MRSLLSLLLCTLSVSGADLEVSEWVVPPKDAPFYPPMDAIVGDTISFTWPEGTISDVFIHPTGTCAEDDSILVGYASGASYTFTEEDAGNDVFFATDLGRRCESGQSIIVSVDSAPIDAQISAVEAGINSAANRNGVLSTFIFTAGFAATIIL